MLSKPLEHKMDSEHTFLLFVRLITPRCRLQGLGGCRSEECRSIAQSGWEQRAASWPRMPLGVRSRGHIRDATDSLSCVHPHTQTGTHICHCLILYTFVRVHTCLYPGQHTLSPIWPSTLHTNILCSYKQHHKSQTLISTSWQPAENIFHFLFVAFVILILSQCLSSAMLFESDSQPLQQYHPQTG